jgi:hypothetical protein
MSVGVMKDYNLKLRISPNCPFHGGSQTRIRGSGSHSSGLEEPTSSGNCQHTGDPQSYRQDSLETLREKDNWVIWKTKDNKWTQELHRTDLHQLLSLNKNTRADGWDNKVKGWWRRGVIKAKMPKKQGVKSPVNVPSESVKDIKETFMTPGQNYAKNSYTIDLTGSEATYWLGTESDLLGTFHFDGACTDGDGS